ncbi:hypothetical protein OG756_41610 (plasmid) [Streptomyces sp. NBC_01310]|uniref:hypothetical protein n=1 Tax=Streptomyces TaxID=1883 RepID=UPI0022508875|nr:MULTISPECIES: hypothetical protein [Streptomyces]MCX5278028.1 hypothetical protein [Streptomyces virginiae]WSJ64517.1 hypothetical protein OG756_41610 [Streptomyces sp. NBC_01310]
MPHPLTRFYRTHVLTPRPYAPRGYVGAAFKEIVLGDGTYETGYLTGCEADLMLSRAAAGNRPVHVLSYGALSISATRRVSGAHPATPATRFRRLDLVIHPKRLTDRQHEDLKLIDQYEKDARAVRDDDGFVQAIEVGLCRIPRTQTSILLARGWVSELPNSNRVWISSAGRIALAWRWRQEQGLNSRLLKGLYLDAALTAASTARASLTAD